MTLNSRRFLTLAPVPGEGQDHGQDGEHSEVDTGKDTEKNRARALADDETTSESPPTPESSSAASVHDTPSLVDSQGTCSECVRENNTYLVEVINYPALHTSARIRKQVHATADYDAVLLVYDVCNRASFDAVKTLHAEIPVGTRTNHHSRYRKIAQHASMARRRTASWFGGGGGNGLTGSMGSGKIVVGLVGNKSDVDCARPVIADSELRPATGKKGQDDTGDVVRASLMSPLYHESIMYAELMAGLERKAAAPPDTHEWLPDSRLEPPPEPVGREEPGSAGPRPQRPDNRPSATPHRAREVSTSDGEALAHQLQLAVPFEETSARSGENIEQVFERVVREVLRGMGHGASGSGANKASKACRHKANRVNVNGGIYRLDPELETEHDEAQAHVLAPVVAKKTATISTAGDHHGRRPASAAMFYEAGKAIVSFDTSSESSIPGRKRMGWMRKMFMRNRASIAM